MNAQKKKKDASREGGNAYYYKPAMSVLGPAVTTTSLLENDTSYYKFLSVSCYIKVRSRRMMTVDIRQHR